MAGGRRDREKKAEEPLGVSEIAHNAALESFTVDGVWDNQNCTTEQMSLAVAKAVKIAFDAVNMELGFSGDVK